MKALFKIKSKPISTNSAYYKRNRAFNANSREWRANFLKSLQNEYNQNQIKHITSYFNPKKHMLRVVFTWFQPIDVLLTSDGTLSLRSMDVDNCLKIPMDCLFDKKYNDKWLKLRKGVEAELYESFTTLKNLDINDKFVFDVRCIKSPSADNDFHCSIEVEIVDLFSKS